MVSYSTFFPFVRWRNREGPRHMGLLWKVLSSALRGQMQEKEKDSQIPRGMEDRPKLESKLGHDRRQSFTSFTQKKFSEVQSPLLGDFFPKHCPTANTTTEAWLQAKGGWWDINFNNPPPCRFPFNYKGGLLMSIFKKKF